MKLCRGTYVELISAHIEYDEDYMQGKMKVRVVSNGFDNTRESTFPDMDGLFIQGKTTEEFVSAVRVIDREMRSSLISLYKFDTHEVMNAGISLIETKN